MINRYNMKFQSIGVVSLILAVFFLNSCNTFEDFGADQLSNEWINAKGIDTFNFSVIPFQQDSVVSAYSGIPSTFLLGNISEPILGKMEAGFCTQLRFVPEKERLFLKNTIDSIVLSLRYDTSEFYGNYKTPMTVEVYPLTTQLSIGTRYYSKDKFQYGTTKLGSLDQFVPNLDSVKITTNKIEYSFAPQMRIPIDTGLFMNILRTAPDTVFTAIDSFLNYFPGLAIVAKQANSLVSVFPASSDSRLTIYYKGDTSQLQFTFTMSSSAAKAPFMSVDPVGTPCQDFISKSLSGDSLIFIQGLNGTDARITMPYDSNWSNRLINYAVLEFYVAKLPGDQLDIYAPCDILFPQDLSSGKPVNTRDFEIARNASQDLLDLNRYTQVIGGDPVLVQVNGQDVYRYKMNITAHFKQLQKTKKSLDLLLSPLFKTESANRVVLYGNKHSQYRAKLNVIYSE